MGAPLFLGSHPFALHTPLGSVCARQSFAVRDDVPVVEARKLLDENAVVVVLTRDNRVRGVLAAAKPPRALTALWQIENSTHELPECAPLVGAFELMAHGHVRLVTVTGVDRRFVGLVADLDVLRWVARLRRSARPSDPGARCALAKLHTEGDTTIRQTTDDRKVELEKSTALMRADRDEVRAMLPLA